MEEQPLIAHLEELEHQQWLVQTIGDVFASLPFTIGSLSKDGLMTTLNYCIAEAGNLFAATRWLGTHQKSLDMMVHEGRTPSLEILMRMCARLKMPLMHFVTGNLATAPKFLSQAQTASKDSITIGPKRKLRKFDSQRMRHELEAILHSSEEPPPSMREVGRRLEYHATHLSHRFPELCQMISARYITYRREQKRQRLHKLCEEVRQAIFAICAQGKYPSNVRVSEMIGNYPLFRHQPLYETWKSTLRELGLKS